MVDFLSPIDMGGQPIGNLPQPASPGDVATRSYVDATSFTSASPGGGPASVQTFTSNDTWFMPAGAKSVRVIAIGGGGGGGGGADVTYNGRSEHYGGGGGAGGGYVAVTLPADALPATVNVTVGQGGLGGALFPGAAGSDAGNGGDSCFGDLIIARGGGGGKGATATLKGPGGIQPQALQVGTSIGWNSAGGNQTSGSSNYERGGHGYIGVAAAGGSAGASYAASNTNPPYNEFPGGIYGTGPTPATDSRTYGRTGYSQPVGSALPGGGGVGGVFHSSTGHVKGGDGGLYGGGAGGGGARCTAGGGKGGDGIVLVITYF